MEGVSVLSKQNAVDSPNKLRKFLTITTDKKHFYWKHLLDAILIRTAHFNDRFLLDYVYVLFYIIFDDFCLFLKIIKNHGFL